MVDFLLPRKQPTATKPAVALLSPSCSKGGIAFDPTEPFMRLADSSVLHRSLRGALPVADRGSGVHLFDAEGRDYIDACGGAAVSCLGHSHPAPVAAIQAQAEQ